ncbi:MAG: methyltransferase [Myxococcales bacterium]|nr:methyltransferase [Myxococcales bacterium]
MSAPLTPAHIMQVGTAFWASKTLLSAVELGVFSELAKHPGEDLESLRGRLGLHPRSARDFFDALVALGFLQRDDGKYRNTPETELFLDRKKPSYVGGLLEMANHRLYGFWGHLTEALRTGKPQNESRHGGDLFAELYADPARLKSFLEAMTGVSRGANMQIAAQPFWARYQTFADVGTAQGDLPVQIARANPHLQGIGFDLAEVAPIFEEYVEDHGLDERLTFVAGDFFAGELPRADVITMGHILHDWDLETKMMLLRKAHAALPEDGALVVYEALIDDERRHNAMGLMMSLNMLIETPGGFDFSGADCVGWMREVGFREATVHSLHGNEGIVVALK